MEKSGKKRRGGWPARTYEPGERVAMSFRVTPIFKAKIDEAARKSGRSLMKEIEFRLEQSLNEERHLTDALELAFGRQVAGLMLAIGCLLREGQPTHLGSDWLSDPKVFRAADESIRVWLGWIDPATPPAAGAIKQILDDPEASETPQESAAIVAAGVTEVEEWARDIDLGPLASTIRSWLGATVIERLRTGLLSRDLPQNKHSAK
jgi:hypothetical protein